jgi:hypothetical protein
VLDDFKRFQWTSNRRSLPDTIWAGMVQAWQIGGSVGGAACARRSRSTAAARRLERIQKLREAHRGLIDALPIPEFAQGVWPTDAGAHAVHHSGGGRCWPSCIAAKRCSTRAPWRRWDRGDSQLNGRRSSGGRVYRGSAPSTARGDRGIVVNVLVMPSPGMDGGRWRR